jgi:hypothetical protein
MDFTPRGWLNPDFKPQFLDLRVIRACSRWCHGGVSGLKGFARIPLPPEARHGVSVAQRRRISTLIMSRSARTVIARATGATVAVSRLWPGRADRLIIAPHDLRTADATRAAEICAGRFVFAGKIVTLPRRFDLSICRRRKIGKSPCSASAGCATCAPPTPR